MHAVSAFAEEDFVFTFHFREGDQVLFGDIPPDSVLISGIDERHAAALEAGPAEPAAVDALGLRHDLVEADLLGRTRFPIVDAAPAGFKRQFAVGFDVAAGPGFRPLLHTLELGVPVLAALRPGLRKAVFVLLVHFARDVPGHGFLELPVIHSREGLQGIDAGAELVHPHVVLGARQTVLEAGEEDGDLVGFHRRMLGQEGVGAVFSIEVQQVVLLAQHLAALVELADIHPDVIEFRVVGSVDQLLLAQLDTVQPAERPQEGDDDRRGGGQAADWQGAVDDAADAHLQAEFLLQRPGRPAQVIRPVARLGGRNGSDMPLRPLRELHGGHLHDAVQLRSIGDVDALVDGQPGDFAQVMVGMRPDGANPVGTEGNPFRVPSVYLVKSIFAAHSLFQRILVTLIPFGEGGDAFGEADVGFIANFPLQVGRVGVGLVNIAGLHGKEYLLRLLPHRLLDLGDEIHQLDRMAAADVVHAVAQAVLIGLRFAVDAADGAFDDVVDIGEVPDHVAVVEYLDGLAPADGRCEKHRAHVRPPPGAVNGEEPQACHADSVQFAVAVGHQFVGLLGGGVEADRIVHLVVFAVGHLGVESVNRTGGSVDQVTDLVVPAGLQDVQEAHQVTLEVGVRIGNAVSHARLRGQVDDFVELLRLEKTVNRRLVGDVHLDKAEALQGFALLHRACFDGLTVREAAFSQPAEFQPHVVIVVDIVDPYDLVAPFCQGEGQLGPDESGRAGNQ